MELILARQFGFDDYDTFCEGVVKTIGKVGLKKLEKELDKFPRRDEAGALVTGGGDAHGPINATGVGEAGAGKPGDAGSPTWTPADHRPINVKPGSPSPS